MSDDDKDQRCTWDMRGQQIHNHYYQTKVGSWLTVLALALGFILGRAL